MSFVSPHGLFGSAGVYIASRSAVAHDYYCADPTCDCRSVILSVTVGGSGPPVVGVRYEFGAVPPGDVVIAQEVTPGSDAARWFDTVRRELLTGQPARVFYERRYQRMRAALLDPDDPAHLATRRNAGLPPLARSTSAGVATPVRGRRRVPLVGPTVRDLVTPARAVLAVRNVTEMLSGADLMALAFAASEALLLTVPEALDRLRDAGVTERNPRKLAERTAQSARATGRFARPLEDMYERPVHFILERMIDAILERPEIHRVLAARKTPAVVSATVTAAKVPATVPRAEAIPVAPVETKAVVSAVPDASAFVSATWGIPAVSVQEIAGMVAVPNAPPADVRLALEAWRLASAAQFDELLAVATMRDVTLHRYQTETVRRVLRALRGRAILADEVGLGKTVEAMMILREYQVRGMVRRALVLVPAPLVGQWAGELEQKAGITPRTTDDAAVRTDPESFWQAPGVVVASLALARGAKHAPAVLAAPWDLVIVDEAHHIKNRTTLGYKLVSEVKRRFLLLVTATPVENDLEEIYNLVTLLRPGQFASPAAFRQRFIDPKDPTRPKDKVALRGLLGEVMVRNTRAQSGLALPPRFVSTVTVDSSAEEKALYEAVVTFVRAHHADHGLALAASALLLEAGSSPRAVRATLDKMLAKRGRTTDVHAELTKLSEMARAVEGTRKVGALLQIVATRREPVLVFTRFRETMTEVVEAVNHAGVTALAFHGGLGEGERREVLERFRAGGAVVMVATAAGSEGHNLQSCAVLVNFDLPWNPMAIEQRIGRLHRMGQTRDVHVYNLCAKGTIEERVLDVLDRRVQLFQLVVGEIDMVLGNLADDRDLEEWLVAAIANAKSDADVDATFDRLATDLLAARGRYETTRALDEALFGKDFEA